MIEQTNRQIADRYVAKQAIFEALKKGRYLTFLDGKEFGASEMHTQMHCIRRDIEEKKLPYILIGERHEFRAGKYCKRYHLETIKS